MKHVILGNGPAGVVAAETLRRAAPADDIVMVGCEAEPPYSRMAIPYMLTGKIDERGTHLRKTAEHFAKLGIREVRGKAVKLDDVGRTVTLDDGTVLPYDRLLIATGSHPIMPRIPGIDLPNVHSCWTLDDARAILAKTGHGARVVQVGAGFVGCIVLEALSARGVNLTVVEMGDRMVPRMMTTKAGNMIRRWVEQKGLRVVTNAKVDRIDAAKPNGNGGWLKKLWPGGKEEQSNGVMHAHLSTGDVLECDLVIASAGVRPNIEFLTGSRVQIRQGVVVDAGMRTSVPEIFAAGDVVEAAEFDTDHTLVSAIQPDAVDQARIAALNMAGQPANYTGSLAMNVLDTMGLISSSFGQWQGVPGGEGVEQVNDDGFRYLSLQFKDDILVGATSIGLTQNVGALRGLIQNRVKLGHWKDVLKGDPSRFAEAYIARAQQSARLHQ